MRAESKGQKADLIHNRATTNPLASDCVLPGGVISTVSSTGVPETETEPQRVQNVGIVLGSVGGTVPITGADLGREVSILPGCDPIIDRNSEGSFLEIGKALDMGEQGLAGSSGELSTVHAKGKMVEYGNVCSLKHRE
ncbi:hypothetical protein ACOSQ4_004139 [Xanthoceras sorbifolium]